MFPESTLERGLFLLDLLSRRPEGCSFSEMLDACGGAAPTTLNRLLKPLIAGGYIAKDNRHYRIGPTFLISARWALGTISLADAMQPFVHELSQRTGDSAAFFEWDGDWISVCAKTDVPEGLHFAEIGYRVHPPHHAFFQAMQPWLSEEDLAHCTCHPDTPVDEIRSRGFVDLVETYQFPHIRIVAPVFYDDLRVAGSLGIAVLTTELPRQEREFRIQQVVDVAAKASRQLLHLSLPDIKPTQKLQEGSST